MNHKSVHPSGESFEMDLNKELWIDRQAGKQQQQF